MLAQRLREPERSRLEAEVRVLPAGDLVLVEVRRVAGEPRLEGRVEAARALPVGVERHERVGVDRRVALGPAERRHHRRHRRLRGEAGHRREREVHHVGVRLRARDHRRHAGARGVVRVHVDRHVGEGPPERADQHRRRARLQEPGHVLEVEDVDAELDELPGDVHVVRKRVLLLAGVADVAGVTDRGLDHAARLADGVDPELQVLHVVERVEDAEDVDAVLLREAHELEDHVVRVARVADRVRAAEEHLEGDVRHLLAEAVEPIPGALLEEAQRDVEGRAAPHLEREERGHQPRGRGRDRHEVAGAHPRHEERLVRVAPRGVGDEQPAVLSDGLRERLRTLRLEELAPALPRRDGDVDVRDQRLGPRRRHAGHPRHRGTVDRHVGDVAEEPVGAVASIREDEELLAVVHERRVGVARREARVQEHVL